MVVATKKVLIAGGGVAALEAVLALRAAAPEGLEIELLCPDEVFEYQPLSVLAAFGAEPTFSLDLARFAGDQDVTHRRQRLTGVDATAHLATTDGGEELPYNALLVAVGCRRTAGFPGAQPFAGVGTRRRSARFSSRWNRMG